MGSPDRDGGGGGGDTQGWGDGGVGGGGVEGGGCGMRRACRSVSRFQTSEFF